MQQLLNSCRVISFVSNAKVFILFFFSGFLFLTTQAQNYTPNTFADQPFTTVNNSTGEIDGGSVITLRSALLAADNLGGTHTITLATGTYLLDGSGNYTVSSLGAISSRTIYLGNTSQDITINGNGAANTFIQMAAAGADRIFAINYDGSVPDVFTTMSGMTLKDDALRN